MRLRRRIPGRSQGLRCLGSLSLLLGLTTPIEAAELHVLVEIRGRGPLSDAGVIVGEPFDERLPAFSRRRPVARRMEPTSELGVASFLDLDAGEYQVDLFGLEAMGLVSPRNNPSAPPPIVTLEGSEVRTVRIEVWPGVPITVGGSVESLVLPHPSVAGTVHLRHRETGFELTMQLADGRRASERFLAGGIWEVFVDPASGYLLDSLIHNGAALAGDRVVLDLDDEPFSSRIDFGYVVESQIFGTVTVIGRGPGIAVEATLLEPGAWFEQAEHRGGSKPSPVARGIRGLGKYELPLASGRYRVRPVSAVPLESDPPEVEVQVLPGESRQIDFVVEPQAGPEHLTVMVRDESYQPLSDAVVEVAQDGLVVSNVRTGEQGRARVFGLEPGTVYELLAGHTETLEATSEIRYHPERRSRAQGEIPTGNRASLVLPLGAGFVLEARDTAGAPLTEVVLDIERIERTESIEASELDPESSLELELEDSSFRQAKQRRSATTDRRGHGKVTGFYPGLYELQSRLSGSEEVLGRVLLAIDSQSGHSPRDSRSAKNWRRFEHALELEVEIEADETIAVDAVLIPAARFSATLECSDGGVLPATADVQVFRALRSQDGIVLSHNDEEPAVALEQRTLRGPRSRIVDAGPLDEGVFELAIKPEGFDRFTWAYESTERERAIPLTVEDTDVREGRSLDLGLFVLECEPAVDLVLESPGNHPFDLSELQVKTRLFDLEREDLEGSLPPSARTIEDLGPSPVALDRELAPPRFRVQAGVIQLERISAGRRLLEVVLDHPHLLPAAEQRFTVEIDLERGGFRAMPLRLGPIGGSLRIDVPRSGTLRPEDRVTVDPEHSIAIASSKQDRPASQRTVRLTALTDDSRPVATSNEPTSSLPMSSVGVRIPALRPGSYRVELCADPECSTPTTTWPSILIQRGVETRLSVPAASDPAARDPTARDPTARFPAAPGPGPP